MIPVTRYKLIVNWRYHCEDLGRFFYFFGKDNVLEALAECEQCQDVTSVYLINDQTGEIMREYHRDKEV